MREKSYYNIDLIDKPLRDESPTHVPSVFSWKFLCKTNIFMRAFGAILIILSVLSVAIGRFCQNPTKFTASTTKTTFDIQASVLTYTTVDGERTIDTFSTDTIYGDTTQANVISDEVITIEETTEAETTSSIETLFLTKSDKTTGTGYQDEGNQCLILNIYSRILVLFHF